MARSFVLLLGSVGGVIACTAEEVPVEPSSETKPPVSAPEAVEADPIDPFYLAIEAERWGVMIDNARDVNFATMPDIQDEENEVARVHRALKYGVQNLVKLRDETYEAGLVSAAASSALEIPEWGYAFTTELPTLLELQTRSDWLGEAIQPFVDAKCRLREGDGWRDDCRVE